MLHQSADSHEHVVPEEKYIFILAHGCTLLPKKTRYDRHDTDVGITKSFLYRDVRVMRGANCWADHKIFRAKLRLQLPGTSKK